MGNVGFLKYTLSPDIFYVPKGSKRKRSIFVPLPHLTQDGSSFVLYPHSQRTTSSSQTTACLSSSELGKNKSPWALLWWWVNKECQMVNSPFGNTKDLCSQSWRQQTVTQSPARWVTGMWLLPQIPSYGNQAPDHQVPAPLGKRPALGREFALSELVKQMVSFANPWLWLMERAIIHCWGLSFE